MRLLALFDIDGTLFLTHDPLAGEALTETLAVDFDVALPEDAIEHVDHQGQTTLRIARLVLRDAGLDDAQIDARLRGWCAGFARRYLELLASADTSDWDAAPGAGAALARIREAGIDLALLTGNPKPMAQARMERLGLASFFGAHGGAFGCDRETRSDLITLARERAGRRPAAETVEIGDTPRDVQSAHEGGIRSILVRSPRTTSPFTHADAVCADLDAVATRLLAWSG